MAKMQVLTRDRFNHLTLKTVEVQRSRSPVKKMTAAERENARYGVEEALSNLHNKRRS